MKIVEIEKFSALSEPDIRGVISALENVIQNKLADTFGEGCSVRVYVALPNLDKLNIFCIEFILVYICGKFVYKWRPK